MKIMLKRLVYPILRAIDLTLQACTIPNKRRLCYASNPDYSDNAYHLFRHALQTRNELEHVWLVRQKSSVVKRIEKEFSEVTKASGNTGNRIRIVPRRSLTGYWLYLTSRHVFHTHGLYEFPRRSLKRNIVSLWHGMPVKIIGKLRPSPPIMPFGTLHIATSHFFKYIMASAFGTDPAHVLVCNYPRNDVLTHATARGYNNQAIRRHLQLPEGRKLALWLPTFRTEPFNGIPTEKVQVRSFLDDIDTQTFDLLDHAAQRHSVTIVIKLHPYDRLNDLDTELNYPNIRLISGAQWQRFQIPLYDLVAASDALLTDVSSILIDYLATGRPIGIVGLNPDTYERGTTFPVSYLFNSGCFEQLDDAASIDRFMASVDLQADRGSHAPGDRGIFMEQFDETGCEHILRHLGL